MRYIIATIKPWNINFLKENKKKFPGNVSFIFDPKKLNIKNINKINPEKIFFIHWSKTIKSEIYINYNCILFHMTDLPYGRGGSPLQNLILRKKKATKITALNVAKKIDSGDIYLKKNLILKGSAEQIFLRSIKIIFKMIIFILKKKIKPKKQKKSKIIFKRLTKRQNEIRFNQLNSIYDIHDRIRMVDAETYPKAHYNFKNFILKFTNSVLKGKRIIANVTIYEKKKL